MVTQLPTATDKPVKTTLNPPHIMEAHFCHGKAERNPFDMTVRLDEPWQVAYTGYNGMGKTGSLAAIGVKALVLGMPVWSNFKVACYVTKRDGTEEYRESEQLDIQKLVDFKGDYRDGVILGDEWPEYQSAYAFNSMQNRLLNMNWMQRRKVNLFIALSAQWMMLFDPSLRRYIDIEVACADFNKKRLHPEKGYKIEHKLFDLSGAWTTKPSFKRIESNYTDDTEPKSIYNLYFKPYRGCYDTYEIINPLDAMAKVEVSRKVISVGNGGGSAIPDDMDVVGMKRKIDELFACDDNIPAAEVKAELRNYGLDPLNQKHRVFLNQILGELGIHYKRGYKSNDYVKSSS